MTDGLFSIQMDYLVGEDDQVYVRPAEVRDIQVFACVWGRNIKAQGFVDVAC
jgi:hypothetical protein